MSHAWSAERTLLPAEAAALVAAQFPGLAPVSARPLAAGWDNTAFLINETFVFRFPRRAVAVDLLIRESGLLPTLAPLLPVAVPVPLFCGAPTDNFPWPFAGYRLIPGRSACQAALTAAQRLALAEPLAEFLRILHHLPTGPAVLLGIPPDPLQRIDPGKCFRRAHERLREAHDLGLLAAAAPFEALLAAAPTAYEARADAVVHGDLYARHLLLDETRHLAGVIDWGDVHLGDPACDLMLAHAFLPPAAHAAFRRAYGPIAELPWRIARLRALVHTLNLLVYAHDLRDEVLLRESFTALSYLAAP